MRMLRNPFGFNTYIKRGREFRNWIDCEQSLSFPSVLRDNKIARDRSAKRAASGEAASREKRGRRGKGKRKRLRRSF